MSGILPLSLPVHHLECVFVLQYFYIFKKISKKSQCLGIPSLQCFLFLPSSHTSLLHPYNQGASPGLVPATTLQIVDNHAWPTDCAAFLKDPSTHTNVSLGKMPWDLPAE